MLLPNTFSASLKQIMLDLRSSILTLTVSIAVPATNATNNDFICANINFDPLNDVWVLCNMFGNITQLYQEKNWFSYDAPNPCNDSWEYTQCRFDSTQNKSRLSSIGDFSGVGDITQSINTTYWPQKLKYFDCQNASFGGMLTFDNLSNETMERISIANSDGLIINLTNMPDLSNFNNLRTFEINIEHVVYSGDAVDSDVFIDKLPNKNLTSLKLKQIRWTKMANFTKFDQLIVLSTVYGGYDRKNFNNNAFPKNVQIVDMGMNQLTGSVNFIELMANSPKLNTLRLQGSNLDSYYTVNFWGMNNNTYARVDAICDPKAYSIYELIKQNGDTYDNYYHYYNSSNYNNNNNYTISTYKMVCIIDRSTDFQCTGAPECFSKCVCFLVRNDWQPALNDFYTVSVSLVLITITVTCIAFSQSINQLIYLKCISFWMIFLTIFWFMSNMIWDFSHDIHCDYFVYCTYVIVGFSALVVYPCTMIVGLGDDFSNFYFLIKLKFARKVLIENKYKHLLVDDNIFLLPNTPRYMLIGPYIDKNNNNINNNTDVEPQYMVYLKSDHFLNCKKQKYNIFYLSKIILSSIVFILYFGALIYIIPVMMSIIETYSTPVIRPSIYIPISICVGVAWILVGITSTFGKIHILCFELVVFLICLLDLFAIHNATQINSSLEWLFVSKTHFGMMDELEIKKEQGAALPFFDSLAWTIAWWLLMLFSLLSTVLYIKYNKKSKMIGTYMYQSSMTLSGTISGLLDYLTDILLIMYWIINEYNVYATIEILLIVFAQIT